MAGVEIISTLSRKNSANFPIALGEDVIGAFVTVASTGARDAIPTNVLRTGAIVRIGNTANYYEWTGSAWSLVSFGGGSGHTIKDEGVAVTPRGNLNFVGINVSLSDDGSNTIVTIGAVSLTAGVSGILPVVNGGTGLSAGGTNGQILTMVSGAPAWATPGGGSLTAPANPADDGKVAIAATGNFAYALIGTANISPTAGIVLSQLANGTACSVTGRSANSSGAHADIASSADGEVFRRAGGALGWGTIATAGIADSAVTLAKIANATALSVLGRSANSSGAYADVPFSNNDEVLMRTSNVLASGKIANANVATGAALDWAKFASAIGNLSFTGLKTLSYTGEVDNGNSSTADTIDWSAGSLQKSTLTGNCTFTFTNLAAGTDYRLKLIQDGTGSRTVTWPAITWLNGSAPTLATAAGAVDFVGLYYDGTTLWGSVSGIADGAFPWAKMVAAAKGQSPVYNGSTWVFFGVATKAANLTDASVTVTVTDGNRMVLAAATLTTTRNLTLGITGSPTDKEIITVERYDTTANTYVVKNNAGTTLYTFPASTKRMASFQYQAASADWILVSHVAITS